MNVIEDKSIIKLVDKSKFQIYYDAYQEGQWFKSLNQKFSTSKLLPILEKGKNPPHIESLIEYDRPDIILCYGDIPILVLERTEEVPSGHNVGQRFARIARSAELHIPFLYFFPFEAQKHGKETLGRWAQNKTNLRFTNLRLFWTFKNLERIHETLVLAINWKLDGKFELLRSIEKDRGIKNFLEEFLQIIRLEQNFNSLRELNSVKQAENEITNFMNRNSKTLKRYQEPPPSVLIEDSADIITKYNINNEKIIKQLTSRKKSLIYKIGMRYVRSDPYIGALIFYDYLYSRDGPTPQNRKLNMICNMPEINTFQWKSVAKNLNRKDIRNFLTFSNFIILKDGIITGTS